MKKYYRKKTILIIYLLFFSIEIFSSQKEKIYPQKNSRSKFSRKYSQISKSAQRPQPISTDDPVICNELNGGWATARTGCFRIGYYKNKYYICDHGALKNEKNRK